MTERDAAANSPRLHWLAGSIALGVLLFCTPRVMHGSLRVIAPCMGFVLLAGVAQMTFRRVPGLLAAVMGAVLFAVCAWIDPFFAGRTRLQTLMMTDWLVLLSAGAVCGYLGGQLLAGVFSIAEQLVQMRARPVYAVPRRFGTGTLLLATTLFALLFAVLQWADARPEHLAFYSAFVATVSIAQMVFERSPRWASILAGGIYLPLSMLLIPLMRGRPLWRGVGSPNLLLWLLLGLIVGYVGGALVAGIFLASDYCNRLMHRRQPPVMDA